MGKFPDITFPAMMEGCEDIIHRDMNENETKNNQDTLDKVIEYLPDIVSLSMMEYCVN